MRYAVDHDMHIHSGISVCSKDPEQTPGRILKYAVDNNLKTIVLTDHFWDEAFEYIVDLLDLAEDDKFRLPNIV